MPYDAERSFEWEVPATVMAVIDGNTFLAMADLGWNVCVRTLVRVEGLRVPPLDTPEGMEARKAAQRLLNDAFVVLRSKRLGVPAVLTRSGIQDDIQLAVCDVAYSPWEVLRSEPQGSFKAAMLAAGHGVSVHGE